MTDEIIDALNLEKGIDGIPDRKLLEFTVRKTFDINNRVLTLESSHKKTTSIVSGITAAITSIVIGVINYFVTRRV